MKRFLRHMVLAPPLQIVLDVLLGFYAGYTVGADELAEWSWFGFVLLVIASAGATFTVRSAFFFGKSVAYREILDDAQKRAEADLDTPRRPD